MKKILLIIMLMAALLLTSCSLNTSDTETSKKITKLPYKMAYNNKSITLNEVGLYQGGTDDKIYVYALIRLDVSSLTEKDLARLAEKLGDESSDTVLTPELNISSEDNSFNTTKLPYVGFEDNEGIRTLYFYSPTAFEDKIDASRLDVEIKISQGEVGARGQINAHSCEVAFPDDQEVGDVDRMDKADTKALARLLNE